MSSNTFSIAVVSSREEFQALEEPWNQLLANSPANTYFLRWEWVWSWWEAFGVAQGVLHILVVKRGERIVGIGPFYRMTSKMGRMLPVQQLLFLGTSTSSVGDVGSEYLDLITQGQQGRDIAQMMFEQILAANVCQELVLLHVPAQSSTMQCVLERAESAGFMCQELQRWQCPYIVLPDSWEKFLETLGSTMRYKFRKNLRELAKHGDHAFRITTAQDELKTDLEQLVRLHQARWEGRGMSGVFADTQYHRFLKMVSGYALQNDHLRLSLVTVSAKPVAALFNLAYGNKIYYYQSGFDTSLDKKVAIGTFAHSLCLEQAITEKLEEYDFLLKGSLDTYKDRWTQQVREIVDYRLIAPGWPSALARMESKARECVRSLREKVS
jgi:CelD/BcsL family acetyltransferase involved in cellulose biosynthesis